jgi:hypothetical protein
MAPRVDKLERFIPRSRASRDVCYVKNRNVLRSQYFRICYLLKYSPTHDSYFLSLRLLFYDMGKKLMGSTEGEENISGYKILGGSALGTLPGFAAKASD